MLQFFRVLLKVREQKWSPVLGLDWAYTLNTVLVHSPSLPRSSNNRPLLTFFFFFFTNKNSIVVVYNKIVVGILLKKKNLCNFYPLMSPLARDRSDRIGPPVDGPVIGYDHVLRVQGHIIVSNTYAHFWPIPGNILGENIWRHISQRFKGKRQTKTEIGRGSVRERDR